MLAGQQNIDTESRPQQKKLTAFFIAAILIFFAVGILSYEIYFPHPAFRGKKEITIAQGMGSRIIGELLKREGVINSKWAFVMYVSVRGEASRLKPGQYEFFDTAAIPDIARDLIVGTGRERVITIPEGWSNRDIARYFAEQNIAPEDTATDFFSNPLEEITEKLFFLAGRPTDGLEGYLFPDTYRIFQDATIESIVIKMLDNFDRKLTPDLREEIARQKKTIFEIITIASLIEKEVASDEDRAVVSGILWKRLGVGIPLQVDATIIYAQTQNAKRKTQNNGRISIEDTKIDSPYNTYRYRGLPLGPIANPGLSAIRAAIYPKSSPYLYYLSAPDGRTIFSRTLDEHNAAKAKYLK